MSSAPIVDRIRIIPRPGDFLDRNVGASGEVFFNKVTNSLRVYSGDDKSGFEIARADLSNVDTSDFGVDPQVAAVEYTVTIVNTGEGNKYVLNGAYWPELSFVVGYTYVFNQDDATNVYYPNPTGGTNNQHPLNFSADNLNGEQGGGTVYTEGVTYKLDNTAVSKQEYWDGFESATQRSVEILVTSSTPSTLYYWCQNHANMGRSISVDVPGIASGEVANENAASVDVSDTVPNSANNGNLWLDTNTGKLYIYIDDGDSEQWIQPAVQPVAQDYNDLVNTPVLVSSINDLSDVDTGSTAPEPGEVLKWNGTQWAPAADIAAGGAGLDADTLDGEEGAYYLDYTNFTNTPTSFADISLNGITSISSTSETLNTIVGASGIVEHDFASSSVWYHTGATEDFTANFTNVPTLNSRILSVALLIDQGATPYLPASVQIDGVSQTILWQNASSPSGTPDSVDLVSFSLIRTGSVWTVIGSIGTYA